MRTGDQVGLYRLEALIAEGGMGSVWRAHHPTLDRHVAIKFVRREASGNEHAREAFMREVRHLSKLYGPQILQIQDFGFTEPGDPYMVTEFLEGEDLLTRLKSVGTIDVSQALYIGVEVLKALGEAHAMGLVHRDLKPGNIFLQSLAGGARTAIKVLDFGVAKLIFGEDSESTLWPAGSPKGSPRYMSPEQILDAPVTPASDFYAFGATLYRSLCGEPVFGGSLAVMIQAHIEATPQPLRDRFPRLGIPAQLDELLIQCLAKAPEDRPSEAGTLQIEFERLLQSYPGGQTFPPPASTPEEDAAPARAAGGGMAAPHSRANALLAPIQDDSLFEMPAVNADVDPLEHTVQPLSMNEPSPSALEGEGPADASSPFVGLESDSVPASDGPIRVQSGQRRRDKGIPWVLLLSALVLVVGAGWYLLADQGAEGAEDVGGGEAQVSLDASARALSLRSLDADPTSEFTPTAPDARIVTGDAAGPTVRVRVVPGPALFRLAKTRKVVCKSEVVCTLPIDVDIHVEKAGYRPKVLSGDDLYDRRGGTWRVVLRRR